MERTPSTIVLVAHFPDAPGTVKSAYVERLGASLRAAGFRLLVVDQAGRDVAFDCETATVPIEIVRGLPLSDEARRELEESAALRDAVATDAAYYGIDDDTAARRVLGPAIFIRDVLRRENAVLCILWHAFNGVSMAVAELCQWVSIPSVYAHLGHLPGTIAFDAGGQMAESWVSTESERFRSLAVSDAELESATAYLKAVRIEKADRKPQTAEGSIAEQVAECRKDYKKIIFYAGQNDYRSGFAPKSLANAELHSPFFSSTRDAALHLAGLAEKNNWLVLFKPHPNYEQDFRNDENEFGDHVKVVAGANIFECILLSDVTVTIVSDVSYLALIHGRPVVLLGNTPLGGKGCAYEISGRSDVEAKVDRAIQEGLSSAQEKNWELHAAQLLKYYLFAFDESTEGRIGRGVDEAARFLIDRCG